MDLDIWIPFFEEDDRVNTDLEVRFEVGMVLNEWVQYWLADDGEV